MTSNITVSEANPDQLILKRAADAISTELDGETVILNIETGVYNGLDGVGTTIWNLLEHPASLTELVEGVLRDYEVSRQQCTADLTSFLQELLDNQLIVVDDQAPA